MDAPINDWLEQYREGDVEALGRLVEHFRRPLFGFLLKMTDGRGDVDELFQEVWFRAIAHVHQYRDKNFLSWLFRIAHNLLLDGARKSKTRGSLGGSVSAEDPIETKIPDPRPGPDTQAHGQDLAVRIRYALGRLGEEQREVFLMRMEGDLSFKEIARIQGVSINTALGRMHYALDHLRRELKEEYADVAR